MDENEAAADRVGASRLKSGGGGGGSTFGDGISTASISLCCAEDGLMWISASSATPSMCGYDRFFAVFVGDRRVGVDALLDRAELLREVFRLVAEAEVDRDLTLSPELDGFGEATTISSSMTLFTGIRLFGIVNGLKKSFMLLLFTAGGMAFVC